MTTSTSSTATTSTNNTGLFPIPGFPGWSVAANGSITHHESGATALIYRIPGSRQSDDAVSDQLAAAADKFLAAMPGREGKYTVGFVVSIRSGAGNYLKAEIVRHYAPICRGPGKYRVKMITGRKKGLYFTVPANRVSVRY